MKIVTFLALLIVAMPALLHSQIPNYSSNIQIENLNRGLVAVRNNSTEVVVSWRLLPTDKVDIAFDVFRMRKNGKPLKLNAEPLTNSTFYIDRLTDSSTKYTYLVREAGSEVNLASYVLTPQAAKNPYIDIPMQPIAEDPNWQYSPNDASVGDLDGDGEYEIVIKREGKSHDNSHLGLTDPLIIEAYKLDGRMLWRINMGPNIRSGAHYTQFIVYDFDGDGRAEIALRTSEGTRFGDGQIIGDVDNDGRVNYVDRDSTSRTFGCITEGPEFLSVVDGQTGKELARTNYISRGAAGTFGDKHANRVDRFLASVGYFDGQRPSVLMCRGYYARTVIEAWNYRNGELTNKWSFDTQADNGKYADCEGQGNHNLSIADVDGDGCDEVTYGAFMLDHNGIPAYNTHLGHGDAIHLTDIDIDRPGLEVWDCHESAPSRAGGELRDAQTGQLIWGIPTVEDVGRALAADIDPRFRGCEVWIISGMGVYTADGRMISEKKPSINFAIWWDGDLNREMFNAPARFATDKASITKWNGDGVDTILVNELESVIGNNWTKATPCLQADIFGDWREELVLRSRDNKHIRIFTTSIPTQYRFYTLMADPVYRIGVATQNVAYNQPPHTGFYLGSDLGKFTKTNYVRNRSNSNNGKSGKANNGRPNGMNERLRGTVAVSVDTLHCKGNAITLDAGCDYDKIDWLLNGKSIGHGRTITIDKMPEFVGNIIDVNIEAVRHGAVFKGTVHVAFY